MGTGRLVMLAVGGLLAAAVAFGLRGRRGQLRLLLSLATAGTCGAVALLLAGLLRPDFSLAYVVGHVSRDLPTAYKVAALWAGQEGTLLLWALLLQIAAHGLLSGPTEALDRRRLAASLVTALATMMVGLLLVRSPFAAVDGAVPADGKGLNPLLRNPWMIIHPPVLFVGYALLAAPCAMAVAAFWRGEAQVWIEESRGWLLLAWVALGAGMMLGGYWAYVTLGWGGFWAWDPVENSSLVPWLYATALLHGARVQQKTGAFAKANFVMAATGLLTVLYGSYLTRSGILGDFSVHSFESLGADYNAAWLALMAVPLATVVVVMLTRRRLVDAAALPESSSTLAMAVWLLLGMATMVLLGMSAPLITKLLGEAQAVQPSFYNRTQSVLFLFAAGLLFMALRPEKLWQQVLVAGLAGLAAAMVVKTIQPGYVGTARAGLILLGGGCGAMVAVSGLKLLSSLPLRAWAGVGAALAHAGAAVMVLGAVLSGPGERSEVVALGLEKPTASPTADAEVELAASQETADGKLLLDLRVGDVTHRAQMYETEMGLMRHPAVFHQFVGDIYLEPEELSAGHAHGEEVQLAKEATETVAGLKVTFEAFEMGSGHGGEGTMSVGARLRVDDGSGAQTVVPQFVVGPDGNESPPLLVAGKTIRLTRILAGEGAVVVSIMGPEDAVASPELTVRITRKPWIWLVWLGSIAICGGGLVAMAGRRTGR